MTGLLPHCGEGPVFLHLQKRKNSQYIRHELHKTAKSVKNVGKCLTRFWYNAIL